MAAPTNEQLAAREAEIKGLVEQDNRDEAGKILFELITACAQGGDVNNANRLRDMLYDVDPMALTSIIKANEIIDAAMSGSISEDFTKAWAGLKEALTEDEFIGLYHALEKHDVEEKKTVVKVGSKLDALFLVNKGNVSVIGHCVGKNAEINVLEPGTMISGNCFHPSFWTVSLVTISPAELFILRQKQLVELADKFPGFENKLTSYYQQFDNIPQMLEEKELKRRRHDRFTVDHKMVFQVFDKEGNVAERTFRAELDNVSEGGLAFLMRIVKRENRWQLFGRRLQVSLEYEEKAYQFRGVVVGISEQDLQNHDYSIHVTFDEPISEDDFKPLVPPEPVEEELSDDEEGQGDESGDLTVDEPKE